MGKQKDRGRTIRVEVKIYYFKVFGKGLFSLPFDAGATVSDVLHHLNEEYGEVFEKEAGKNFLEALGTYFNLFLNGKPLMFPVDLQMRLKDQDKLLILRPVSGG